MKAEGGLPKTSTSKARTCEFVGPCGKGIKVADEIKGANQMTLKEEISLDYPDDPV